MKAEAYYRVTLTRSGFSLGGLITCILAVVDIGPPSVDWKNNLVRIVSVEGEVVREFSYGSDRDGAFLMKEHLDHELAGHSKDEFEREHLNFK